MAKRKSALGRMGASIRAGAAAVADVAQAALTGASDLPEDGGYKPVKTQRWAREVEATGAKRSAVKRKTAPVRTTAKKSAKKKI